MRRSVLGQQFLANDDVFESRIIPWGFQAVFHILETRILAFAFVKKEPVPCKKIRIQADDLFLKIIRDLFGDFIDADLCKVSRVEM